MTCATPEQIAAAASGDPSDEARGALAHALTCERCAALLAEQRELRALAGASKSPSLDRDRRAAMAARIAQADVDANTATIGECLAHEALAEAALDDLDPPHVATCERCADLLEEQRDLRALARQAVVGARAHHDGAIDALWPRLDTARRDELAAEVMARADALPRQRRRTRVLIAGVVFAAAAAIVVVVVSRSGGAKEPIALDDVPMEVPKIEPKATAEPIDGPTASPISEDDLATAPPAVVTPTAGAQVSRETTTAGDDVVTLRDGGVTIDAAKSRTVVVAGTTRVDVARARVSIVARRGVVETVQVFAGSVEVTTGGNKQTVQAGAVWRTELSTGADGGGSASDSADARIANRTNGTNGTNGGVANGGVANGGSNARVANGGSNARIANGGVVGNSGVGNGGIADGGSNARGVSNGGSNEPAPQVALRAFREGWTLLRAKRHREAIAAFDRATDPVVAEDATFWAAVAAERAGDRADAARRFADFTARFPASPRIDSAREAARRLAK